MYVYKYSRNLKKVNVLDNNFFNNIFINMGRINVLNESRYIKLINLIAEQEEENFYRVTPEEYKRLLMMSNYNPNVTKIKKFKGKPLYIDGNLDLSGMKISTLGNVIYVNGNLDVSNTKFLKIPGQDIVMGRISHYNTPYEYELYKEQIKDKLRENDVRRDNREWEGSDELSMAAQALYKSLVDNGDIDPLNDDEKDELETLKEMYVRLEDEYERAEDDEIDEIQNRLDEISQQIDGMEERNIDIYNVLYPMNYGWYGESHAFIVLPESTFRSEIEYAVIHEDNVDGAKVEYAKNFIDDAGLDGFNQWFIEQCMDEDQVVREFEEMYNDWVRDEPDSYFSESDFELTDEQEQRKEDLENYIGEIDEYIDSLRDEMGGEDNDEIAGKIDDAERKRSDVQDELYEIVPDTEPSEEMIQSKVEELVDYVRNDVVGALKEYGMELKNYIDTDCLLRKYVDDLDFGDLSSYTHDYDIVDYDGEEFYITRIN